MANVYAKKGMFWLVKFVEHA